jgi:hypothetical protein
MQAELHPATSEVCAPVFKEEPHQVVLEILRAHAPKLPELGLQIAVESVNMVQMVDGALPLTMVPVQNLIEVVRVVVNPMLENEWEACADLFGGPAVSQYLDENNVDLSELGSPLPARRWHQEVSTELGASLMIPAQGLRLIRRWGLRRAPVVLLTDRNGIVQYIYELVLSDAPESQGYYDANRLLEQAIRDVVKSP